MRKRIILTILLLAATLVCAQFHGEAISVTGNRTIRPPEGARHTENFPVADNSPREAIIFDFPDSLFRPTTAIVEAFLIVKIVPDEELSENRTLDIFCFPQTESMTGAEAWIGITNELLEFSELGTYNPETGEVFFEISHILQSIRDSEVAHHGFILVPAAHSPSFSISDDRDAISLKVEYRPGKKEIR